MIQLSIIIVNYNVEHFLEQCLLSVRAACRDISAEVIVIDNASVDGSVEMVREKFPDMQLIANVDNKGFSKANNQGIRIAKGRYVLLLNPDTIVEEDTFKISVQFMDDHPDCGGLGVRMLDGKGQFLPESKRGLPTPEVAFYKIFGISNLFPRSKRFGRYHLGYLDEHETHEIEILSGAYMCMRKSALDEVGLLDEDYFMYGEDIDLSYRLIKGGYKNYYTPDTRIIHYKGESTKKTSVNYVLVFYNAMRIFARKHFSASNARFYNKLIEGAIYARAGLSLLKRFIGRILHPAVDVVLIYSMLYGASRWYESQSGIDLPLAYFLYAMPIYAVIWSLMAFLSSGYEHPLKGRRKVQGAIIGTGIILVLYALLPEDLRYSRAMILIGAPLSILAMLLSNAAVARWSPSARSREDDKRRYLIIGDDEEQERITHMMLDLGIAEMDIHHMAPSEQDHSLDKVRSMTEVYQIDEVIFCAKDLSAEGIIDSMSRLDSKRLDYKIAPPESMFIIGSNSKDNSGDLLTFDLNAINKPVNLRNKRLLDAGTALALLLTAPVLIWFQHRPIGYFSNCLKVLVGRATWVGYHAAEAANQQLPKLKISVLQPDKNRASDHNQRSRSNLIYAKDYQLGKDIDTISQQWRSLGDIPS